MTLFEALTGGAFDRLTGNRAGNLTKIFPKSQMPRGLPGGGMGGFGIDRYIIQRLFSLSASLGFHGLPLFKFKTDRLDFRGLDRG